MNHRKRLIALALLALLLATPVLVVGQNNAFVWRTSDIAAEVVRNDADLGIGQYLRLRQSLRPQESGWTEMKIDLPETWQVLKATPGGEAIEVVVAGGAIFRLTRENVGELTFRILNGAKRLPDAQLDKIWRELALAGPR